MPLDAFKNNAKVTVSLGYDAAATQIVLQAGDGNKLPAVPFNGEWWNSTDYTDPTDDPNKEIIRFTTQTTTDTFTIVRAQESTSASTKNTAGKVYKVVVGLTAKTLNTDVPATYTAYNATMTTSGGIPYVTGSGMITEDDPNFHWDDTNVRLGIGTNVPGGPLHIVQVGTGGFGFTLIDGFGTGHNPVYLARFAGGSPGSPTAFPNGTVGAQFRMDGYNSSAYVTGKATINMGSTQLWAVGSNGSYIAFVTTPNNSPTTAEAMRVDQSGFVGIGTTTPATALHVVDNHLVGGITIDGTNAPGIALRSTNVARGNIGIPTASGQYTLDDAAGDIVFRAMSGNIIESVDGSGAVSTRRMTRPFKSLTNNSATTIFSLTVANNTQICVELIVCSECTDGTNMQIASDRWVVVGWNKAGVISSFVTLGLSVIQVSSGTFGRTLTASSANPIVLQLNLNSSLTPSAGYPRSTITIENFTRQAIGPA